MKPFLFALVVLGFFARPCCAEQVSEVPLAAQVEEFERNDQELKEARAALASRGRSTAAERRRLEKRIEGLENRQGWLIQELERMAGPLPPAVRQERPAPVDSQLESRRLRDDAILEQDVERRLP